MTLKKHDSSIVHPDDDNNDNHGNQNNNDTVVGGGLVELPSVEDEGGLGEAQQKHHGVPEDGHNTFVDDDDDYGDVRHTSPLMYFVPRFFRFDQAPSEATGLSIDFYGRGHIVMASLFLGPALLELAEEAAERDCSYEDYTDYDDDAGFSNKCKIYGFLPSSLLSNIAIWSGILGSLAMPIIGAVIDHTPYRLQVANYSALALGAVKGIEIIVGKSTWFLVAVFQVISSILYNVHATAAYSYTSELTSDPNQQSNYNAHYNAILFVSMLVFLLVVLACSALLRTDDVGTARISQAITSSVALSCFVFAWSYFFNDRPALSQIPHGQNLCTCGFIKVYRTSQRVVKHYRSLSWAIAAMMCAEAAMSALSAIAITYLKAVLDMSAGEIGAVFFLVLGMGIPGSYLGGYLSVKLGNPIRSALVCDVGFIVVTGFASYFMRGPENKNLAYIFASLWGAALGWLPPVDTTIFMHLMPGDSRAEFMGIMMLAAAILSWLPPLVFSILNESGVSMAWGLASLNLYFVVAIGCLLQIPHYTDARQESNLASYSNVNQSAGNGTDMTATTSETAAQYIRSHLHKDGNSKGRRGSNANIHDIGLQVGGVVLESHREVI